MDSKVDVTVLHHFYRELDDLIGEEAMLLIYQQYKGMQMTIPTHLYDRELTVKKVLSEYNGSNQQALARKYGYSQKWVQRVIHQRGKK
ncbi:Mor transcription activator family protein [Levilactobacillus zymae]|uniref:Mor transcription activator family protein n=1 Tax=Levilactobacillus zymae TaxID=267363 RepID=UPI003FCD0B2D